MHPFTDIFSAFGLSSAAGLNAYLPLLVVALTARFTNLIQLNEPWDVMTSWWVIGALAINTFIRPVAGAILFAASSGVAGELHPVLAFICGLVMAGGVHAVKATARPVVTATTAGTGNWLVSAGEDVVAFVTTVLAILVPVLLVFSVLFAILALIWWRSRRRARYRDKHPSPKEARL
jgi:hypothetical protein